MEHGIRSKYPSLLHTSNSINSGGRDANFASTREGTLTDSSADKEDVMTTNNKYTRRKRHGPLYNARIECAHFLSQHSTLDTMVSLVFRRRCKILWWMLISFIIFRTLLPFFLVLFPLATTTTPPPPTTTSVTATSKRDTADTSIIEQDTKFQKAQLKRKDKKATVRRKSHRDKQRATALREGNPPSLSSDNKSNRNILKNTIYLEDTNDGGLASVTHIIPEESVSYNDAPMLPSTKRMIGAFATSSSGSGGIYDNDKIHYFPSSMEVYKSHRAISQESLSISKQYDDEDDNDAIKRSKKNKKKSFVEHGCEPMYEWQGQTFPTCNVIHEAGLGNLMKDYYYSLTQHRLEGSFRSSSSRMKNLAALSTITNATMEAVADNITTFFTNTSNATTPTTIGCPECRVRLVNNGWWRDVWLLDEWSEEAGIAQRVLKTLRYEHDYEQVTYEFHRRDAVAMERLTGSPYILDIYGFCANSGLFEFSSGGDILDAVLPERRNILKPGFPKHMSSFQKLLLAVQVSLGIRDLHNFEEEGKPTIVHADLTPSQFVAVDGFYKLNDFNVARFLSVYRENNKTCSFVLGNYDGTFRAPEEYNDDPQTEKIDVYSMGNVLYFILTELWPFKSLRNMPAARKKLIAGDRPEIPGEATINSTDPALAAIAKAIHMCWIHDPAERATAADVSDVLITQLRQEKAFREEYLRPYDDYSSSNAFDVLNYTLSTPLTGNATLHTIN